MYFMHSMYNELIMIKYIIKKIKKEENLHQLLFIIEGLINSIIPMKV